MAGKFTINGQTITQKQDGTWLGPDGNKMSNESVYRIFGNKTIKQDPKTGKLNFDWDQYNNRTSEEKRRQLDHEMEFSDGAYDATGNPRTRDYKKRPRTRYDDVEDEMSGMMDEFRGKGFWQPSALYSPPVQALQEKFGRPRWEDIQRAQLDRGPGFTEGEVYDTPTEQMSPSPTTRAPTFSDKMRGIQEKLGGLADKHGIRKLDPEQINQLQRLQQREELDRVTPQQQPTEPFRERNIFDYLRSLRTNVQ